MLGKILRKPNLRQNLLVVCGAFLLALLAFLPSTAEGITPFGGPIITIVPCVDGLWITLGPPVAGSYMWTPTTFSYLFGPPAKPKQWLLGMAGPPIVCFEPCPAGLCPIGGGLDIIFHGSSAPTSA